MKLIQPSVKTITQEPGLEGIYKACADAAYICYQTDPDAARLTPEEFLRKVIIPNGHNRVLEFGTVYLEIPYWQTYEETSLASFFKYNPWSKVVFIGDPANPRWAVTTNLRVIVENNFEDLLEMYLCEPSVHARRYTANFTCSRGAGDDFRTHVGLSSIMESSRFCNYSKDKFGRELTFIDPYWKDKEPLPPSMVNPYEYTLDTFKIEERRYMYGLTVVKMEPQEVKRIYPLGAKVQLRLCGFTDAWENFFRKRADSHADPECQLLANQLKDIIYK